MHVAANVTKIEESLHVFTYHACNLGETHSDPAMGFPLKVYVQEVGVPSICVNANKHIAGRDCTVRWTLEGEAIVQGIFCLFTRKLLKPIHVTENNC